MIIRSKSNAKTYCQHLGGELAFVNNMEDFVALRSVIWNNPVWLNLILLSEGWRYESSTGQEVTNDFAFFPNDNHHACAGLANEEIFSQNCDFKLHFVCRKTAGIAYSIPWKIDYCSGSGSILMLEYKRRFFSEE